MNLGIKHPPLNKRPLSIKHSLDYKKKKEAPRAIIWENTVLYNYELEASLWSTKCCKALWLQAYEALWGKYLV